MTTPSTASRSPAPTAAPEYATAAELAQRWHMTPAALAQQRYTGTGPKYLKVGRRVRYRWADILAFEAENVHERTA